MTTPVIKMPVAKANLEIHKGEAFKPLLQVTNQQTGSPIDYRSYTGTLQFWATTDAVTPIAEYSTSNGGLVLGNGTIQINITDVQTAAYTFSKAYYTLRLTAADTTVTGFMEGLVQVYLK